MPSIISIICLLVACLSSVEAFFPYKITHGTTEAPVQEKSMADYVQEGFTFTGNAGEGIHLPGLVKLAIKKQAIPSNTRPIDRSTSEIHHRQAKVHARSFSNVKRDDKFTVTSAPPPSQTNSLTILDDGTDFSYYAFVNFGSNSKQLRLLLDSGAANTWVMGSDCTTTSCKTHRTYGPSDSTTLENTSETFSFNYGSGHVSGVIVTDSMAFAGHTISLAFGTASVTSDTFNDYPMDGILGLGRDSSNAVKGDTFMETVAAAKIIPAKQFGMSLERESDGSMYGEINFGAPDTSQYDGDLQFTDTVSSQAYWEIPCDGITVDGASAQLTGKTTIIDSGTTYILMPAADVKQLHAMIPGSVQEDENQWNIPCDTGLDVQLVFSGKGFSVSPEDYVGPKAGALCSSHFIGMKTPTPDTWIVGDVFMKNVYTLFDFDGARIGFGVKGSASSPSSSAPPASPSTVPSSPPPSLSRAAPSSAAASAAASTTAAASSAGSSRGSSASSTNSSRASSMPILLPPVGSSAASSAASAAVTSSGSIRASATASPDGAPLGASSGAGRNAGVPVGVLVCLCFFGGVAVAGW